MSDHSALVQAVQEDENQRAIMEHQWAIIEKQRVVIDNQRREIESLRVTQQNQAAEIQSLKADRIAARDGGIHQPQLPAAPPPTSASLPEPPLYDGRLSTLLVWIPSIRENLRAKGLERANAFQYVWDHLVPRLYECVHHLRHAAEATQSWDPECIIHHFRCLAYTTEETEEAVRQLKKVRQQNGESVDTYLVRYRRLMYEAGALAWPNAGRIKYLHQGLHPEIRKFLEGTSPAYIVDRPYKEYTDILQQVAAMLQFLRHI